ncbi:adenylate/guanylate cyclase domain-containing protein [Leptospira mtsangambouensis]|uniref:Adenylate/guanylate cyclase domain-containing protein n=1 Tax=Leptospira mtsangambouensis TaxID=2484912 RepID=A0ABY2P4X5_9LEPT|nr:adenylate/guanylate cyclase domain-containing protein [Leptospira mtsangambouensis]TGM82442.1 adenylate/guanylate cyclase domain-containing protein [Leptospira mtsangambouensis]
MAKHTPPPLNPPNLIISKSEAKSLIEQRIRSGKTLLELQVNSDSDYENLKTEHQKWTNFNTEMFTRIFENKYYVEKYEWSEGLLVLKINSNLTDKTNFTRERLKKQTAYLSSFIESLELIPSTQKEQIEISPFNRQKDFTSISDDYINKDPEIETIFIDIVGFSKRQHLERLTVIEKLNKIVKNSIQKYSLESQFILLPTGDGVAISILTENALATINIASELRASFRTETIPVRIGINKSRDTIVKDVNDRINISGPGIIGAQRIMDFAKSYKINISESVYLTIKDRKDSSLFGDRKEEKDKHNNSWIFYEYEG